MMMIVNPFILFMCRGGKIETENLKMQIRKMLPEIIYIIVSFLSCEDLNTILGWSAPVDLQEKYPRLQLSIMATHMTLTEEFIERHTYIPMNYIAEFQRLSRKFIEKHQLCLPRHKLIINPAADFPLEKLSRMEWKAAIMRRSLEESSLRKLYDEGILFVLDILKEQKCSVEFIMYMIDNPRQMEYIKSVGHHNYMIVSVRRAICNQKINKSFIQKYHKYINIVDVLSHQEVSEQFLNELDKGMVKHYFGKKIKNISESFIKRRVHYVNWPAISEHYPLNLEFVKKYEQYLYLEFVFCRGDLSTEVFEFLVDRIKYAKYKLPLWTAISKYQNLSDNFIEKHKENINFEVAIYNKNIDENTISKFDQFHRYLKTDTGSYAVRYYSEAFIRRHKKYINWDGLSMHQPLSRKFIDANINRINFTNMSMNRNILYDEKKSSATAALCDIFHEII